MHRLYTYLSGVLLFAVLTVATVAGTFSLTDGQVVTGEPVSFNENGMILRQPDGKYSQRVPWGKLSQDDLKELQDNPKAAQFVEPFIELTPEEKAQKTGIVLKDVPRLERLPDRSVIGSLFSSGLGLMVLLALYAANIYAALEIAVYRARPKGLVCGIAAVAPIIGPVVFLCMPTHIPIRHEESSPAVPEQYASVETTDAEAAAEAHHAEQSEAAAAQEAAAPAAAASTVYQRGQYTFNRRFFETRTPDFLGVIPAAVQLGKTLVIKSARGDYSGHRISSLAASELHLQVQKAHGSEDVKIPFIEIQQVEIVESGPSHA